MSASIPDDLKDDQVYLIPSSPRTISEYFGKTYKIDIRRMLNDLTPDAAQKVADIAAEHVSQHS